MCSIANGNRNSGNFFLKVDHELVNVENHPVKAFDILFKLHFVFNIEYAKSLENFYDFIAGCIYKISKPRPSSDSLNTCLFNIPVDVTKVLCVN